MNQILVNIKNPEWWFTGLFFLVIGILLTKAINSWLPAIWRKITYYIPSLKRGATRWLRLRLLKKVRNCRSKDLYINWIIGRYLASFSLFVIYSGFVVFYFATSVDFSIKDGVSATMRIAVIPLYICMIIMAFEKKYLFRLLEENHKIKQRIITRSRKDCGSPDLVDTFS